MALDNTFFGLTGSPEAMQTEDQANELLKRLQMAAAAGTERGDIFGDSFMPRGLPFGGISVQNPDDEQPTARQEAATSVQPKTIAPSADPRYLGTAPAVQSEPPGAFKTEYEETKTQAFPPAGPSTTQRPQPQVSSASPMRRAGQFPVSAPAASAGGSAPVINAQGMGDLQPDMWDRLAAASNAYDRGGLLGTIATGMGSGLDRQFAAANSTYKALLANGVDEATAQAAIRNPEIMKQLVTTRLGAKSAPQWVVLGNDRYGNPVHGTYDPSTRRAYNADGTPYLGASSGGVAGASDPNSELSGEEFLKTLPKDEQNQIKALVEGRLSPPPLGRKNPYWEQLLNKAGIYEPGFDATTYKTRAQAAKAFTSGVEARNITALNTAINHMSDLSEKIDGLGNRTTLPILNKPINAIRAQVDPEYQKKRSEFSTNRQTAITEIAKALRGVGSMTMSELHEWESKFNDDSSPEVMKGAMVEALKLLKGRMEPLADQYNKAMGKNITLDDLLSPKARAKAAKLLGEVPEAEGEKLNLRGVPDKPPAGAPRLDDGSVVIRNPNFDPKKPISATNPKFLKHTE